MVTTLLTACTICGGDLFYDALDDEWKCFQSGHRFTSKEKKGKIEDMVRQTMETGHGGYDSPDPPVPECRTFQLPLHIHTKKISATPGDGVCIVHVEMMIVRQRHKQKWRIEYLDLEPLRRRFGTVLRGKGIYPPLYISACNALAAVEIYPEEVRGWSQWFKRSTPLILSEERSNGYKK